MHSRPMSSLGRILLVAGTVGLGSMSLLAQDSTSTSTKPMAPSEPPASRIDIFAGYSYLAPHGQLTVPGGRYHRRFRPG